ncbi:MAG TPA: ATP-binding protein [Blastocatellia bacterium]|nr:ATP-binding protein [Blastocatellia bacterium]
MSLTDWLKVKEFTLKLWQIGAGGRRWHEDRKAIVEFHKSLSLLADPDTLMASIAARLKEIFGTDRVVLLRSAINGLFTPVFQTGYDGDQIKQMRLAQRDRLAQWLQTNATPLIMDDNASVLGYLNETEREQLKRLDIRVCLPLSALNRLTGIMLLSSTANGWHLDRDDLSLLQMLMSQASIAYENAYLYQQQNDRLRRLTRAESLATAGQLAASLAHEIRNPLTSIRSIVQYLLGKVAEQDPQHELMAGVIQEVDHIDRTLEGLLSLTRATEFRPQQIALGHLIKQSLLLIRPQGLTQSVEIVFKSPPDDVYIMGDIGQLKQVFLNLMLNALQAMRDGGRLDMDLSVITDAATMEGSKRWARVLLTDTGSGIPAEHVEKIFDPFFTTKQGGTGLGLATAFAIIQQHSGELDIASQVGEGTTVTVKLPLA